MEEKTARSEVTAEKLRKELKRRVTGFMPFQLVLFFLFGVCIALPLFISSVQRLSSAIAGNEINRSNFIAISVIGIVFSSLILCSTAYPVLRNLIRLFLIGSGRYTIAIDELESIHEETDRGCLIALFVFFVSFWYGILMLADRIYYFKNGKRYPVTRRDGSTAHFGTPGDPYYLVTIKGDNRPTLIYNTTVYDIKTDK